MEILVRLIHSVTRRKFYEVDICLGIQLKMGLFENRNVQLCSFKRFNDHNSDVVLWQYDKHRYTSLFLGHHLNQYMRKQPIILRERSRTMFVHLALRDAVRGSFVEEFRSLFLSVCIKGDFILKKVCQVKRYLRYWLFEGIVFSAQQFLLSGR